MLSVHVDLCTCVLCDCVSLMLVLYGIAHYCDTIPCSYLFLVQKVIHIYCTFSF